MSDTEGAIEPQGRSCGVHLALDDLAPLEPLLDHLRNGGGAPDRMTFPRGVLLPDGRLDLCKQGVGPLGAAALRIALRGSRHVRDILLGADQLGVAGANEIAGIIEERPELRTVYMGCNSVGDEGAKILASSLRGNTAVRGLWVKRNHIGVEGAVALAGMLQENSTLRTLDLVSNDIGVDGAEALMKALATARTAGHGSVELLYLCGNKLGPEGAKRIAAWLPSSGLRAIYLSGNSIGDDGAIALAQALRDTPSLEVLGLSSNEIGVEGAKTIAKAASGHPSLETLEMGFLKSTEVIGAAPNHFGDDGARAFAKVVQENSVLSFLDLGGSGLTVEGAKVLVDAMASNTRLATLMLGMKLPDELGARLSSTLCRNANRRRPTRGVDDWRADVARIKSVYRSATSATPEREEKPKKISPKEIASPAVLDIEACTRVLRSIVELGEDAGKRVELGELVILAHEIARNSRKTEWGKRAAERARNVAHDLAKISQTGIRRGRVARIVPPDVVLPAPSFPAPNRPVIALEAPATEEPRAEAHDAARLSKPRGCYVCKRSFSQLDSFYDQLCPACATLNRSKRDHTADLRGRVAMMTGGRIKIGMRIGLKLLRAGARLIVTTRFPFDAASRYEAEPDAAVWRDRLEIHGLDLRFLGEVERFGAMMARDLPRLDVLVHNAAQTVARPPGFHAEIIAAETRAAQAAQATNEARLESQSEGQNAHPTTRSNVASTSLVRVHPLVHRAHVNDGLLPLDDDDAKLFPVGSDDGHGQPLDLRGMNSWKLRIGQVSTAELVSVHAVSALAPFVLTNALRDLLVKTAKMATPAHAFVVNVSAVEAQFHRSYKSPFHPHTNMAKAALNMMARTAAEDLSVDGVLLNAVDTGWITNENPFPISEAMADHGFEPPLDEEDGAARVLDPVFSVLAGGPVLTGNFLKDYLPAPW